MNNKVNPNDEKIRNLLNELQASMPILSRMKKLQFPVPMISFKLYKNHIETILALCKNNLLCTLSWRLFQHFFEGENDFLDYTGEKESDIGLAIDLNQNEQIEHTYQGFLLSRGLKEKGKLFKNYFTDLTNTLESLNIGSRLITMFILFFLNNELTLPLLIKELTAILKDKYPKCSINVENVLKENITPYDFINKFIGIKDKFDNYTELIWDDTEKKLKINSTSIKEIINDINEKENKNNKKNKKNKKKKNKNIPNNTQEEPKTLEQKNQTDESQINSNSIREDEENKLAKNIEQKIDENIAHINSELQQENEKLRFDLLDCKQELDIKEFYLNIIGLRIAFKTLIDIFFYIFKLDGKGNLEAKIHKIKNFLYNKNSIKKIKIEKSIDDIYKIIKQSNFKAHFIDFSKNLIAQILEIVNLNNIRNGEMQPLPYQEYYKDVFALINYFGINDNFVKLVKLRTNKFDMDWFEFVEKEKKIIEKIIEDSSSIDIEKFFK